jgi:hypothetical protein
MKCTIIEDYTRFGLQSKIQERLEKGMIIEHISFSIHKDGYNTKYMALIIYHKEEE